MYFIGFFPQARPPRWPHGTVDWIHSEQARRHSHEARVHGEGLKLILDLPCSSKYSIFICFSRARPGGRRRWAGSWLGSQRTLRVRHFCHFQYLSKYEIYLIYMMYDRFISAYVSFHEFLGNIEISTKHIHPESRHHRPISKCMFSTFFHSRRRRREA